MIGMDKNMPEIPATTPPMTTPQSKRRSLRGGSNYQKLPGRFAYSNYLHDDIAWRNTYFIWY